MPVRFRWALLDIETTDVNRVLDDWTGAGWRLDHSSTVQLGEGYGIRTFVHLMFAKDSPPKLPASP